MNPLWYQIIALFILAIPIACVARTVIFEEIFREPRDWCMHRSKSCASFFQRKFFYLFTCEYCFSHYVTIAFLLITRYKLLYEGWRGYLIAFFALVFVANAYLNLYSRLRVDITSEKKEIELKEREATVRTKQAEKLDVELANGGKQEVRNDA